MELFLRSFLELNSLAWPFSLFRKYAMFAAFDAAAAFLFTMGAPNTPATLQNIINQTIIPITMLATAVVIRVRYQWLKIGGAGIIMLGAGVAIIPLFFNTGSEKVDFVWYAVLIYFLNNIPQSLSNVTKELAFNGLVSIGFIVLPRYRIIAALGHSAFVHINVTRQICLSSLDL